MKKLVLPIVTLPMRLTPMRLGMFFLRLWLHTVKTREVNAALEHIFELEERASNIADHLVIRYDDGIHVKHRLYDYHAFFTDRIEAGEVVADIGCGKGELCHDIATTCNTQVYAIDIDPEKIKFCEAHFPHPNIDYMLQDALEWTPPVPVHTIVMSNVLEHIEHRIDFLTQAQDRLKPERWIIRVPRIDKDWRAPLKAEMGMFPYGDPTHYTEFTPESFEEETKAAGLKITWLESRWCELWAVLVPCQ